MLRVVFAKFETGQTFSPVQTDATLLAYNSQHCWELLRPFARGLILIIQVIFSIKRDIIQSIFCLSKYGFRFADNGDLASQVRSRNTYDEINRAHGFTKLSLSLLRSELLEI